MTGEEELRDLVRVYIETSHSLDALGKALTRFLIARDINPKRYGNTVDRGDVRRQARTAIKLAGVDLKAAYHEIEAGQSDLAGAINASLDEYAPRREADDGGS